MSNQEKKKILLGYCNLEKEIERNMEELERWKSRAIKVTSGVSDIPKGEGQEDQLQIAVERICELKERLDKNIDEAIKEREKIETAVEAVGDNNLRLLLRYRYIDGMTWEQIAVKMGYDYRWILRLHGRALEKLTIESHIKSMISLK